MQSPMVVEVYREQLAAILDWHRHEVDDAKQRHAFHPPTWHEPRSECDVGSGRQRRDQRRNI